MTAAEIAAFLGITPSGVRHIIRRHGIPRVGTIRDRSHAVLYDVHEVLRHARIHDRRRVHAEPVSH